jgi:signal transduction histidine kinase
MSAPTSIIVRGRVDRQIKLISADQALLDLQMRIGGALGGPMLVPQLARLAALVQRIGTPISRPVIAADDGYDYSMWGRFLPDAQGTAIELTDWVSIAHTPQSSIADDTDALSSQWMWACDAQLRLTALWPDTRHAHVSVDVYLGQSLTEIFALQADEYGRFALLSAMANAQECVGQRAELMLRLPYGMRPPVYILGAQALQDDMGRFTGFSGRAIVDIDTVDMSPQLPLARQASVPAAQPAKDLIDFGKNVDANMRAPIGRIIANADSIAARVDGPIRQDYANYARDIAMAGRHLMGLIDDLADVQVIERAGFNIAQENVDLADVARRAAGLLGVRLAEKSMSVKLPPTAEICMAQGEFRRILQILINLIGNAVRYSPSNSEIWISTDEGEANVSITIADQGAGIATENQSRIFDKFERLGRSDHGGSGLGLYISRKLARAMQGDLRVESAPGAGARFTLSLPKA